MFKGRNLIVATKHEKELVIAPILEKELAVSCIVSPNFDTDQLGTFTGEVERKDDPITTARKKCLLAMELTNCDMAIASEGSFGPHPTIYFVPSDDEFLLFLDKKNDLEIIVREISTETNFRAGEINSEKELTDFADSAKFPSHALILRKHKEDFTTITKGISDWDILHTTYNDLSKTDGRAYIETDMRAMYNPTRMKVIETATYKLANKIKTACPKCKTPGFSVKDAKEGLPCEVCSFPTRSILSYMYTCVKCSFSEVEMYPHGKVLEEPLYCDVCNP